MERILTCSRGIGTIDSRKKDFERSPVTPLAPSRGKGGFTILEPTLPTFSPNTNAVYLLHT